MHPMTEGSLALASDRRGVIQKAKAKEQVALVRNIVHDPQLKALTEPTMLMTVIAMTLGLCILWFFVIFTLYHIARFAL
jgi:hypothetical protein